MTTSFEISGHLLLLGLVILLLALLFIAWLLANLVLSRLEPGSDNHRIVAWWEKVMTWPVVLLGYLLPVLLFIFLLGAAGQLIEGAGRLFSG